MFQLQRPKPGLLGIDISTAAVKLLELSRDKAGLIRVEACAVAPLAPGAIVDRTVANVELLGDALKAVVKQSGTRLKTAAVAVPTSAVITKIITMPASLGDDELELQIELEADRYIPYPLDEVSLDFEVQGPNARNAELMDVLIVASRKENVDDRLAALDLAGIKAGVVDVESYALENAFSVMLEQLPEHGAGQTTAIADVGATMMTLDVVHDGRSVYVREQGFGGKELTEEIQSKYGLSFAEAGLAKKLGGLPESYLEEVLDPFRQAMARQINVSLQFFRSSGANRQLDRLLLAGGCAQIRGIREYLETALEIPTLIADPFAGMALANRIKAPTLRAEAPALMVACGLALRSFD
ncbi:pilus assembly protein PilM [Methylolobus aquaticus]|nr:pilus assembly protein PilM [Methylolobus aquaticus]